MKKLVLSLAALAALAGGQLAWADAECQAGSAWGTKPGCGHPDEPVMPRLNNGMPIAMPGYGWGAVPYAYGAGVPQVYVDPRNGIPQQRYYDQRNRDARNSRDRDGDGVRNNRDRYPDDPRYR